MDSSDLRQSRRRRLRRLAAATTGLAGVVVALGVGVGAGATTIQEPAAIARQAYFTYPLTQVTPPLLTAGFPPGTACLVAGLVGASQICGPEVQAIGGLLGLSDGLPIPVSPDGELAQPVVPGTTPIGMLGGQHRYASLLQLTLPTLPEGEGFTSFELVLHQSGLNFAVESPALRAVVLALLQQVEEQDPAALAEDLAQALTEGELVTDTVTGIEACPTLEPWAGGDAQGAAADGTRLPDADCVLGTTGVYDPGAGTWTFDLTFAVQAWTEGAPGEEPLANEGFILRAVGAPNLAYGDPDLSTNWVVSVGDAEAAEAERPIIRYTTAPVAAEADPGPSPAVDVPDLDPGSPVPLPPLGGGAVVTPTPPAAPVANLAGALRARYAERTNTAGSGYLPGWVWLAIPLVALGATLFGQSLRAPAAAGRRRPGALTRLVALDEARTSTPSSRS